MLQPEGFLAVADLDKEDGSFHADPTGVEHKGFSRDHLVRQMMDAGFTLVSMETVHHIEKPGCAVLQFRKRRHEEPRKNRKKSFAGK